MNIAIDARMITYTGIGRYIQNLIVNLANLNKSDTISVLLGQETEPINAGNIRSYRPVIKVPVYSIREQWLLPVEMGRRKPDIIHYPSFNMPLLNSRPAVATIHDLIYYLDANACPNRLAYMYARFMFNNLVNRTRKIITDSEFVKGQIIKYLDVSPDRIKTIPIGVGSLYRPVKDGRERERLRKKYGIREDFVFYAGNHQPRKNLMLLLEAFSTLRNRNNYQLVLTGKIDPRRKELYEAPKRLGIGGRVLFIGPVPEEDLPGLYSTASLFAFPSLNEGFGLPPLEAMACGTPVLSSNATSLPEVVGDAGILVDATDAKAFSEEMDRILSSRTLRDELGEKGLKRAKRFTWEATAKETYEVYKEVLSN